MLRSANRYSSWGGRSVDGANKDQSARIIVGLITYKSWGGVAKLLAHIAEANLSGVSKVIVVDNDPASSGVTGLEAAAPPVLASLLEYHHEMQAGIPFARNRVLSEASKYPFDYIAMLDDDEYPTATWLVELIAAARTSGADVVGGLVVPVLEGAPEAPIESGDFQHLIGHWVRGREFVGATSNVLMSRRLVDAFRGAWFSADYASTGGSDTEFLRRTFKAGFRHATTSSSVVFEDIPRARMSVAWLVQRAYRLGNGITRMRIGSRGFVGAAMIEGLNLLGLLSRALLPRKAGRGGLERKLLFARIRGKIDAFRTKVYEEYSPANYRAEGAADETVAKGDY